MTLSQAIQDEQALSVLTAIVRAHPDLAQRAGRTLWSEFESSVERFRVAWPDTVKQRLHALEHARGYVLEPRTEAPISARRRFDWFQFVEMMQHRQRARGDLSRVTAKQVYLDTVSSPRPGTVEDCAAASQELAEARAFVDLAGYEQHLPRADHYFVGLLSGYMASDGKPRLLELSMQVAVVLLVARVYDVSCTSLGLGREIPCISRPGYESREYICSLAKEHHPRRIADRRLSDLICGVAESLRRALALRAESQVSMPAELDPVQPRPSHVTDVREMVLIALDLIGAHERATASSLTFLWRNISGGKARFRSAGEALKRLKMLDTRPRVGSFLTSKGLSRATELRTEYSVGSVEDAVRVLGVNNARGFTDDIAEFRLSRKLNA